MRLSFSARRHAHKVKRLSPSFGGAARFIPEKYRDSMAKGYTFLYFKKEQPMIIPIGCSSFD
ncbi:hypothetical protein BK133_26980 [Paenibacillus sp. FSL H8-0548]|nr:hypothetical protein BK133_26980 [Paenibacillus sp. FSL H8-0548]